MARTTAIRYRDWLDALWLLDPVPAWRAPGSVLRRLSAGPKHHLADPALAARALDVDVDLLLDGQGQMISGHRTLNHRWRSLFHQAEINKDVCSA